MDLKLGQLSQVIGRYSEMERDLVNIARYGEMEGDIGRYSELKLGQLSQEVKMAASP